ncbi:DUF1365 domain-containing protein [Hoeflea sp. TYP-13]|uniref:DUF1365 domain-containing protein n=1 Tax=Hoeflea sp. TYP-13 TaxID=3230023 RepID=UPI0034C5F7D7
MKKITEGVYVGAVMHRRLRPKTHKLKYSVFSMLVDIDHLPDLGRRLRLFSHNRFNLYSIHERDLGSGTGLRSHLAQIAHQALGSNRATRFLMLCYPRILGYVFNPLTVYYGLDENDKAVIVIYEVSNTFGQRHTYALAANGAEHGIIRQRCGKVFHVSPFNGVSGSYSFRTRLPARSASVAILLHDDAGPVLAAHFAGEHRPLTDQTLTALLFAHGFMTAKVWLGIHYEALKLWGKRLKFHKKPPAPVASVTTQRRKPSDIAA